jgi:hypothetical protein
LGQDHHSAHEWHVPLLERGHGFDVFLWDNEQVQRGFRMNVLEGQKFIVFIDLGRGNLARNDSTEQTTHSE